MLPRLLILLLSLSLLAAPLRVFGCAIAPRENERIFTSQEEAVIFWDDQTKTEHFIRRAEFSGKARDFGFLVPTPSVPEMSELANDFSYLSQLTRPVDEDRDQFDGFDLTPLMFSYLLTGNKEGAMPAAMTTSRPPVRVLAEQSLAGYDTAVLEADNAQALDEWLKQHEYQSSPALVAWLDKYIKARWKITAFKVANNDTGLPLMLGAVRMSFKTEQPFYPYREPARDPASAASPGRTLRVWFIGNQKMNATIGTLPGTNWPAEMTWSNLLNAEQRDQLAKDFKLTAQQLPAQPWLTELIDRSSPRPATDELFFAAEKDQRPVIPPPNIRLHLWQYPLPLDVVVLLLLVTAWLWRRRREVTR